MADGQLVLEALRQRHTVTGDSCSWPQLSSSCAELWRYLVRAQLLPEAGVGAGHVHRQTVLHPLQEGHPALALLLEALPPQQLRLHLAAPRRRDGGRFIQQLRHFQLLLSIVLAAGATVD